MYQQSNQAFIYNQYLTECPCRLRCSHMFFDKKTDKPSFAINMYMQYGYTVYIMTFMSGRMKKPIDEQITFKNDFTTCWVSELRESEQLANEQLFHDES